MGSIALKNFPLALALMLLVAAVTMTSAQDKGPAVEPKKGTKGNPGSSNSRLEKVLDQVKPYQNSTALFSERFGKPPRISEVFHYPVLPDIYWTKHKRPFVPVLDPELYGDFNDGINSV